MKAVAERRVTGRMVLFGLLAFFGVIFLADGIFVYLATSSWTGTATDDAYRKGLNYNQMIEQVAAQQALGWQTAVSLDPLDEHRSRLSVTLRDRTDLPIDNRIVTAILRRPVTADHDIETPLVWSGAGLYTADLTLPAKGHWDVRIAVAQKDGTPYLIEVRAWRK